MTTNLFSCAAAFSEGEVLLFPERAKWAQTAAILCGVSGQACEGVPARLIICDGEDTDAIAAAKEAHAESGAAVILFTKSGAMPEWTPTPSLTLSLPLSFAQFRRAVSALCSDHARTNSPTDVPTAHPERIRVEGGFAVSGSTRVALTPCEEKILTALTEAYPHAAKRSRLEEAFSRHGSDSVRVYVTYLRKKLAALPAYRAILPDRDGGFALVLQTDHSDKG
ncbi:MAG: helix-turn-helix domain-containing protein [Clostridia bacterium]|nr:helix-turn-helix domain-containing protein [Clostridia bacterium]